MAAAVPRLGGLQREAGRAETIGRALTAQRAPTRFPPVKRFFAKIIARCVR
jgi:hypothetical protein